MTDRIVASLQRRVREFELRRDAHLRAAAEAQFLLDTANEYGDPEDTPFLVQMQDRVDHHRSEARGLETQRETFANLLRERWVPKPE